MDETAKYDFYRDPYEFAQTMKFLGTLSVKSSLELKNTPMGIGFETLDRDTFNPEDTYELIGQSGVKYARCQTGWMKCEREKGVYDFRWLDDVVDELGKRGIKVWFSVSFGHPLYTPVPAYDEAIAKAKAENVQPSNRVRGYVGEVPLYHGKAAMEGFLNYTRALTEHFRGRVSEYEIWNEPNGIGLFWNYLGKAPYPELSAEDRDYRCAADYVELIRQTGAVIRSVIPDARIIGCTSRAGSEYVRALGEAGFEDVADVFSYHRYENNENSTLQGVTFARKCLGQKLEFWQGESGRATGKSILFAFPTEHTQAKYIARRAFLDLSCGAKRSSIFTIIDFKNYYPDGSDQKYGLINGRTLQPKTGYYALQTVASLLENTELAEDIFFRFGPVNGNMLTPVRDYRLEIVPFRRNGIPAVAFWQPETVDIAFPPVLGELQMGFGRRKQMPHPVLIDTLRRNVYEINNIEYPGWAHGLAVINPIAVPDYPVILTDRSAIEDLLKL